MIKSILAAAAVLTVASVGSAQTKSPSATLRVDVSQERHEIPPGLYGLFIEDINHAVDGGLYAELVQNRSFEEGVVPRGTRLVEKDDGTMRIEPAELPPGVSPDKVDMPWPWTDNAVWLADRALVGWSLGGEAEMATTEAHPMNDASSRSLEVKVNGDSTVELANSGYWGMNFEEGVEYDLRFFLRPGSFTGNVKGELRSSGGGVLASHDFGSAAELGDAESWHELSQTLTSDGADPRGQLVLVFEGSGTMQIDFVSLFPPTFKNRENGLRPDLAQYLADYDASFLRWPGGCFVQGWSWDSAPDFRRQLGAPEERPGFYQYWKYRSTDGFGYHEFLQFAEDIGSDPIYVVFAGMTVHPEDNVPLEDLQPWIDNALAAIEYANGPVDSEWGAKRAAMGHPEPFHLKHVEIGNEHLAPIYGEYYVRFRDAIKEKYPDMNVIMSMFWSGLNRPAMERAGVDNIDMVDEHAYRDVNWIRSNFDWYDRYPREGWDLFVGEYASQQDNGNWAGGLGDSLFLMMTERNGDLVKMATYAPLFRNVNDTTWPVNLIDFDASRSYAHGSYYVQTTFNDNLPDVDLAIEYDVEDGVDPDEALLSGQIGLGAFDTQVEFRHLKVFNAEDELVYEGDFDDLAGWRARGGDWSASDGVLSQTGRGGFPALLLLEDITLEAGRIEVEARRTGGSEGFILAFGVNGRETFAFANCGANGNEFSALQERGMASSGRLFRETSATRGPIEDGRWYDLSVSFDRDSAEMSLGGERVSTAQVERLRSFFATAGLDREADEVVVKATNYHAAPMTVDIELGGVAGLDGEARHISIAGPDLRGDNDFDDPTRIVPRTTTMPVTGASLTVELPPYSVNVLRLPMAR